MVTCSGVRRTIYPVCVGLPVGPRSSSRLEGTGAESAAPRDWQTVWKHPLYVAETFVDPERNRGTCYRAANWTALGLTKGRGKDAPTHASNRSLKLLFGYPLVRDFRERLCAVEPSGAIMSATAQSPPLDVDIRQI